MLADKTNRAALLDLTQLQNISTTTTTSNFFIKDLIVECINLNRGALIGEKNISMLGYCDDLTLMSPSYKHLYELLEVCDRFALTWKLKFNGKKSSAGHFEEKTDGCVDFFIGAERIPNVKAFIHLGLPIGNV